MQSETPDFFLATPLLDPEIADILFGVDRAAEQAELRSMLADLESDVGSRLGSLLAQVTLLSGADARRACHPLKGNTSSFGLARCAAVMAQLEHGWDKTPVALRTALLEHARIWLNEGAHALRTRFPYLAAGN